MEKEGELHTLGITKNTPQKDAIKYGNCVKGRDCNTCSGFCKMGSGFLVEEDFPKIAKKLGITEAKLKMNYLEAVTMFNKTMWRPKLLRENNKSYGQCVFFNDTEKCTIHGVKPLHCKVSTCEHEGEQLSEWFYLNHVVDANDPVAVREWAQRLKVKNTIPGGELHEIVKDEEKLKKVLTYETMRK